MSKLTRKQDMFCKHYVANGFNGTQASISAGYSKHTCASISSENLQKPEIVKKIEELKAKMESKIEMTAEWKLEKLKKCIEASLIEDKKGVQVLNHKAFLGAITESNKMQGHYMQEKKLDDNAINDAIDLLNELIMKNKKDY